MVEFAQKKFWDILFGRNKVILSFKALSRVLAELWVETLAAAQPAAAARPQPQTSTNAKSPSDSKSGGG